jgi:AraC-like DNA-binding protein
MKINSAYVTALKQVIRDLGHDPADFIDDHAEIDEVAFFQICNRASDAIKDPTFALRYGSTLHLGTHGILGTALMSCRSLRQAAEFLVRHNPVNHFDARVGFAFDRDNAILSFTPGVQLPASPHFLTEVFLMAVVNAISEMVGAELEGCHVDFAFEPAMPEAVYQQYIGLPVRFRESGNRFVGPRGAVHVPLPAAANEVADIYVRQCSRLLNDMDQATSCTTLVRRALLNARGSEVSEHLIAQKLNMSSRTLRRRLADERTSFREISDALRNSMALAYLRETRLPIAEIGLLLGFDDVANFRRAFRRWNGASPQDFRRLSIPDDSPADNDAEVAHPGAPHESNALLR